MTPFSNRFLFSFSLITNCNQTQLYRLFFPAHKYFIFEKNHCYRKPVKLCEGFFVAVSVLVFSRWGRRWCMQRLVPHWRKSLEEVTSKTKYLGRWRSVWSFLHNNWWTATHNQPIGVSVFLGRRVFPGIPSPQVLLLLPSSSHSSWAGVTTN